MIRVMIERTIAEGQESYYDLVARSILRSTLEVPGFVSGESMRDLQRPLHRVIMTQWRSEAHWEKWYHSDERRRLMGQMQPILVEPERIILLESMG